ncbi:MAG: serine/threonine-protein phosphatase [Ferruginibacter sp.]|nr:serine/threonine-protein phosphatase [Ferruginibacter sp.]
MGENFFGITDTGKQRTNNEDRFIAQATAKNKLIIACVIDGVGGYAGGEVAAQLTREAIVDKLKKVTDNIVDQMISALQIANERIAAEKAKSPQNEKMACVVTLAVADIEKNTLQFAHIGDTRLYLFRDGSLIKITKDHSPVGFLEESGRLSEAAAMMHPKRNEVNKALGFETNIPLTKDFVDTGGSPFLPGDTVLICSDGLTDMIPASEIISILNTGKSLAEKGKQLVDAANEAGGRDNITVVLVHNDKLPAQHTVTKPLIAFKKNEPTDNGETEVAYSIRSEDPPLAKHPPKSGTNRLLLLLCIIFFLGLVWLAAKNYLSHEVAEKPVEVIISKLRNQQEIALADSINASANGIVKLTAGQRILITDTVFIKNDSLHLMGNGSIFTRDSAYAGPAFVLASNCKYILLDSMTFENFNTGISVPGKGLHLKNLRFSNCIVPLQFQQQFKDTLVSGVQAEPIFHFTDTLHK